MLCNRHCYKIERRTQSSDLVWLKPRAGREYQLKLYSIQAHIRAHTRLSTYNDGNKLKSEIYTHGNRLIDTY